MHLCNLLGPLCNTYRFNDGSWIWSSTRESITLERDGATVHMGLFYERSGGYEFVIPDCVNAFDRHELVQNIDEYCRNKRIRRYSITS